VIKPGVGDLMVCMPLTDPLFLSDNVVASCSRCSSPIQHRPYNPPGLRLVCPDCLTPDERGADFMMLPQTADDLAAHFKKRRS
jgi:hypothetical protein